MIHITLAVWLHIFIFPVFPPTISGAFTGHVKISNRPRWHHMIETGKFEPPDGAMVKVLFSY
jgi:hypothetical protein